MVASCRLAPVVVEMLSDGLVAVNVDDVSVSEGAVTVIVVVEVGARD